MGIQLAIGADAALTEALPVPPDPRAPHAGDELRMHPGRWDRHRDFARAPLPEPDWRALDAEFMDLYPRVLTGRAAPADLHAVADAMGLTPPPRLDKRPALPAAFVVDDVVLADISEDQVPDVGMYAAERVLGPFAELPLPQRAWTVAGAVIAFARLVDPWLRPVDRFYRDKPRPPQRDRSAVKAVDRSPPMLWAVRDDRLVPLLPLSPTQTPGGPRWPDPPPASALLPAAARACPAVVARVVPLGNEDADRTGDFDGAFLSGVLPLPVLPDVAALHGRLTWELWRMRRHELRLTWEDLLRERSGVLYRAACEGLWEAGVRTLPWG